MATKQGGFLTNLGKRMLGFSTSSSACCAAPGSTQQEATGTPAADEASACCTPTIDAQAAGACCEESVAAAPSACCGSEPALVTALAAPAGKTRGESADAVREVVRETYGAAARRVSNGGTSCCGTTSRASDPITSNLYGEETAEIRSR